MTKSKVKIFKPVRPFIKPVLESRMIGGRLTPPNRKEIEYANTEAAYACFDFDKFDVVEVEAKHTPPPQYMKNARIPRMNGKNKVDYEPRIQSLE